MDLTTISTALSSLKTATEIAKLIKNSDNSLEQAESKLKLADLISALADAKIQMTEIQQVLLEKDDEIKALNQKLNTKEKLQWEQPYYWRIDGNQKEGPFCQQCYDKNHELIRLQGSNNGYWECKTCKNFYKDKNYDQSPRIRSINNNSYLGY